MASKFINKINDTTARIGEVRFSYVHVLEPAANSFGGEPQYSTTVLWKKTDKDTTNVVMECIAAAKERDAGRCWSGKIPSSLRSPVRDGDEERPDDPTYAGMYFMNLKSKNKPQVRELKGGQILEVFDEDIYSGMWGAVVVSFYGYNAAGNKGVGASLGHVIKTRDDERMSGGVSVNSAFADLGEFGADSFDDILR